jgi:putative exosortase-associated protein (TIGR04073 family)
MRISLAILPLLLLLGLTSPAMAQQEEKPEATVEKMAGKLTRGVTNIVTSVVEIPKQTYLTVRDRGASGYIIGPLKGVGMTLYRLFAGATETVFFLVPQPGYYDPMADPDYVWNGWERKVTEPIKPTDEEPQPQQKKGE